ncbi:response regulator [Neptunomonas sp.]|uniref:response regulator n=1 Tax=Neptunomonas sp. TaxID=1971898 RepID=UPI00356B1B92
MSATTKTILIVEDEHKLAQLLLEYMEMAGYQAYCLHDGDQVIPWLNTHQADLLILDLMLPGKHGDVLCREIRRYSDVPIIMATARVEEADRLKGLEIGADDYVCKPYSLKEMVARVKAILRRMDSNSSQGTRQQKLNNLFDVNPAKMSISVYDQPLDLTPVEFRLLEHFITYSNIVFSRDDLLNVIYDDYRLVSERTVDSHIKNLRKKIHHHVPDRELIRSIYGAGYIFETDASSN